jgi:hypothetical protein
MARRYGGKYSPETGATPRRPSVDPVGARVNLLFVPPVVLLFFSLGSGAVGLALGLAGAAALTAGAWLLRGGLQAEAAYMSRKVAHRPALPRKMLAAGLAAVGTGLAAASHLNQPDLIAPLLYGLSAGALHLAAFGIDPLSSKGMEGIDSFQQDRVARVVDEAEQYLTTMTAAIARANDREAEARVATFQTTARTLIRTIEEDPRDLTAGRKYLSVYLMGARDATVKYADLQTRDPQDRADYLALLDDLDQNFAARTQKSLLDDRSDLTVEIEVLRDRLAREGLRTE